WLFFFSSRRRHTRSDRDWSSDVCSSDLSVSPPLWSFRHCLQPRSGGDTDSCWRVDVRLGPKKDTCSLSVDVHPNTERPGFGYCRSEERRVGKECRFWQT